MNDSAPSLKESQAILQESNKFPKLSEVEHKVKYFAYCDKCVKGFENDVDTLHPKCPNCGVLMMNMAKEAIETNIKNRTVKR